MKRKTGRNLAVALFLLVAGSAIAQQPAPAGGGQAAATPGASAPLFFKEEWKQNAANNEHPASQESVANPNLELKMYGENHDILVTGSATDAKNPIHVWTGSCTTACAVALRDKTNFADLTGAAKIKWITKMSGFHQIRPVVKLADGTWLVGEHADGVATADWVTSEVSLAGMRWMTLDIAKLLTKGNFITNANLSKVDEIGFVDLMPASGHGPGGWADVATFEVYGKPVPR